MRQNVIRAPDTIGGMMTREVVTVAPDDPVERAVRAMLEYDIGSVAVAHRRLPVGAFTERDLLHWVGQVAKE